MAEPADWEPQSRARCNTWPLPQPGADGADGKVTDSRPRLTERPAGGRRNPWGEESYAELITQALCSVPQCRLTLAQIYAWLMLNVPYFGERSDHSSSSGWKNSVRHNLSLHRRFVRVPNKTGPPASWWTLDPSVPLGSVNRRRASSMESTLFEKRRVKARRNARLLKVDPTRPLEYPSTPMSPDSSTFVKSSHFRPRASSTASSCCSGRLSPISSAAEDWPSPSPSHIGGHTDLLPIQELKLLLNEPSYPRNVGVVHPFPHPYQDARTFQPEHFSAPHAVDNSVGFPLHFQPDDWVSYRSVGELPTFQLSQQPPDCWSAAPPMQPSWMPDSTAPGEGSLDCLRLDIEGSFGCDVEEVMRQVTSTEGDLNLNVGENPLDQTFNRDSERAVTTYYRGLNHFNK